MNAQPNTTAASTGQAPVFNGYGKPSPTKTKPAKALSFSDFVQASFTDPHDIMSRFFYDAQDHAAALGITLEGLPTFGDNWHYTPNLEGKKDQRQGYKAELDNSDRYGLVLPVIVFNNFTGGGIAEKWTPRPLLWAEYEQSKKNGIQPPPQRVVEHRTRTAQLVKEYEARKAKNKQQESLARQLAVKNAGAIWEAAKPVQDQSEHPYLVNKGIQPNGARLTVKDFTGDVLCKDTGSIIQKIESRAGDLLLPMYAGNDLVNLQKIPAQDSGKYFLTGGQTTGAYYLLGGNSAQLAYVVEGFATGATVHQATQKPVYIAFSASNVPKIVEQKAPFIGGVAADARETGTKYANLTGLPVTAPPFSPEQLQDKKQGDDWNDYAALYGLDQARTELEKTALALARPQAEPNAPKLVNGWDVADHAAAPEYLIDGILEADAHGLLGGASQSFKSFLALKMAFSVCSGQPFLGHEVYKTGAVVFVCGEGEGAIKRRLKALKLKYGTPQEPIYILGGGVSLASDEGVSQLSQQLVALTTKPALVIFDTFASLSGGIDENSNSEAGAALNRVRDLARTAGASSLIVHHFGKDSDKGFRGASAFLNNVDYAFTAKREGEGVAGIYQGRLECVKMKDGEFFAPSMFTAQVVSLGIHDQKGREVTSLAVLESHQSTTNTKAPTKNQQALDALKAMLEEKRTAQLERGEGNKPVSVSQVDWYARLKQLGNTNPSRSKDNLLEDGLIFESKEGNYTI